MTKNQKPIKLGIERLLDEKVDLLKGVRVGLVCNQASVNHDFNHAADLFHQHAEINLTTLFGPQHGIRGDVQDNMIETEHATDRTTGLPIYSLYSETREPSEEMLREVDVISSICRTWVHASTRLFTLANCMRAAKKLGKRVIADRLNPINGTQMEGVVLDPAFASFVGQFPIATVMACLLGWAGMLNDAFGIGCDFESVTMDGWFARTLLLWYDETDSHGFCAFAKYADAGRGTVFPGSAFGRHPNVRREGKPPPSRSNRSARLISMRNSLPALNGLGLAGVYFRRVFSCRPFKSTKTACGGVQVHVTNRETFHPALAGIAVVKRPDLYGDQFGEEPRI